MILSVSRRTDIPAFYSEWFMDKIYHSGVMVRNPYAKDKITNIPISTEFIDCMIFWTKNPKPMLDKIPILNKLGYKYYFQFTLNYYNRLIEPNLPKREEIIETFIKLSSMIGKDKVIWRYDPIIYTNNIGRIFHISSFKHLIKHIGNYTNKCVISFVDVDQNIDFLKTVDSLIIPDKNERISLLSEFVKIANEYGIKIETCSDVDDYSSIGVEHAKCIDPQLISNITGKPVNYIKDKNQRKACGCLESTDIGQYNTCFHGCRYCYATKSNLHIDLRHDPKSPLLIGTVTDGDKITTKKDIIKRKKE